MIISNIYEFSHARTCQALVSSWPKQLTMIEQVIIILTEKGEQSPAVMSPRAATIIVSYHLTSLTLRDKVQLSYLYHLTSLTLRDKVQLSYHLTPLTLRDKVQLRCMSIVETKRSNAPIFRAILQLQYFGGQNHGPVKVQNHGPMISKSWENLFWQNHGKFMAKSWQNHGQVLTNSP